MLYEVSQQALHVFVLARQGGVKSYHNCMILVDAQLVMFGMMNISVVIIFVSVLYFYLKMY